MAKLETGRGMPGSGDTGGPEGLSMGEIVDRYPDEWVLVHVTAWGEYRTPTHGVLLAHDAYPMGLLEPHRKYHREYPEEELYTFCTSSHKAPSGEEEEIIVGR